MKSSLSSATSVNKLAINMLLKYHLKQLILLSSLCLSSLAAYADDKELPDPLSLEQALEYAKDHPRTQLNPDQVNLYSRKQTLYLNCHNLAYNNDSSSDPQRDNDSINLLIAPELAQQLAIMERFFDVDLADLNLMHDNENMASAYISYDRANIRRELKQYSETYVAELDAEFHKVRQQYYASQASQQMTRGLLAQALNQTNNVPRDLNPPKLPKLPKELPETKTVLESVLKNNNWLTKNIDNVSKPEQAVIEMRLKQHIQELLLRLSVLKAAYSRADKESLYRDLKLENSRTLYEQEVKADLGDSMAQQTRTKMEMQKSKYCQTLTWAQLNALQGKPLLSTTLEAKPQ